MLSFPSAFIYSLNCLAKVRFIIIIIITLVITFMQGIYNYVPETNHVSRVYSVAAFLYFQFVLRVMLCYVMLCYVMLCYVISPVKCVLYFHVSTFSSAQYGCFFGSSLISFFPGMLLGYCMSDFEMVPVAPVITVITHDFTFHMRRISVMRS